jgi:hypothetical protein
MAVEWSMVSGWLDDPRRVSRSPDWVAIAARVGTDPGRTLGRLVPRGVVDKEDPYAIDPDAATIATLALAAAAISRLATSPTAPLTAADRAAIALLAHIAGRPAIPVASGRFANPPKQWSFLSASAEVIDSRLASVGRIDAPAGIPLGTGFLVGDAVVMTNRHVAELLVTEVATFRTDAVIDFSRELDGNSAPFAISNVLYVSSDPAVDLALLAVEPSGALPPPLAIVPEVDCSVDRVVYAIGFPIRDKDGESAALLQAVFRDELGVKRLQPGLMKGLDATDARRFAHDCSTLGGSSGSCIVDFETGLVCGLHFGVLGALNAAVALWQVARDPAVAKYVRLG